LSIIISAEFGNHDLERHTAEYLKDFALFPKVIFIAATLIDPNSPLKNTVRNSVEHFYLTLQILFPLNLVCSLIKACH